MKVTPKPVLNALILPVEIKIYGSLIFKSNGLLVVIPRSCSRKTTNYSWCFESRIGVVSSLLLSKRYYKVLWSLQTDVCAAPCSPGLGLPWAAGMVLDM